MGDDAAVAMVYNERKVCLQPDSNEKERAVVVMRVLERALLRALRFVALRRPRYKMSACQSAHLIIDLSTDL